MTGRRAERLAGRERDTVHTTPHHTPETEAGSPVHATWNLVNLQQVIGNKALQRLLAESDGEPLQRQPAPGAAAPAEEIVFDEAMIINSPEINAKALRLNRLYSQNPPQPGWPYTPELVELWEGGLYDDFTGAVTEYQVYRMGIPLAKADGIVGPKTAAALLRSRGKQPEAAPGATPGQPESTGEQAAPVADESPAPTAAPISPDNTTYARHPVAARILAPVQEASSAYYAADKVYDKALKVAKKDKNVSAAENPDVQAAQTDVIDKRITLNAAIAAVRTSIQALTEADFNGSAQELKAARAYMFSEINALSTHYSQGENANILADEDTKASGRTCNITVVSMILETLGKSPKDYTGSLDGLATIATEYSTALGIPAATPEAVSRLRLPDFLQLVAIQMSQEKGEQGKDAHEYAVSHITHHSFLFEMALRFGVKPVQMNSAGEFAERKEKDKKGNLVWDDSFQSSRYNKTLSAFGLVLRNAAKDAAAKVRGDKTFQKLDDDDQRETFAELLEQVKEDKRTALLDNVNKWIETDEFIVARLAALKAAVEGTASGADAADKGYSTVQPILDQTIAALDAHAASLPKEKIFKGKSELLQGIVNKLNEANKVAPSKPAKAMAKLHAAVMNKKDLLDRAEKTLESDKDLQKIYDAIETPEKMEAVLPIDDYKKDILARLTPAMEAGHQVIVNLESHFVRLQSLSEDGVSFDDPASTVSSTGGRNAGENSTLTWEQARAHGYFKNYLILSR